MQLMPLYVYVVEMRNSGKTYEEIAIELGIKRSLVRYIEKHQNYNPSLGTINKLPIKLRPPFEMMPVPICFRCGHTHEPKKSCANLDPSPALLRTRTRRQRLNEQAIAWGYLSWSNYETIMMTWQVP